MEQWMSLNNSSLFWCIVVGVQITEDALGACLWHSNQEKVCLQNFNLTQKFLAGLVNICWFSKWMSRWMNEPKPAKKYFQSNRISVLYWLMINLPGIWLSISTDLDYLLLLAVEIQFTCTLWLLLSTDTWWQCLKLQAQCLLTVVVAGPGIPWE